MKLTPEQLKEKCRDGRDLMVWGDWFIGPISSFVKEYLKDKKLNTCIDIGAATGMATGFILYFLNPDKMICCEPDEDNFSYLTDKYGAMPNITLYNKGIFYGVRESAVLGTGDESPLGYMVAEINHEHISVWDSTIAPYSGKVFKFLELEEVAESADLIKIDVEGSEYNIIENSTLLQNIKWILLETHNHTKEYVDNYLATYLPNHKVVYYQSQGEIHMGYFLEKIN